MQWWTKSFEIVFATNDFAAIIDDCLHFWSCPFLHGSEFSRQNQILRAKEVPSSNLTCTKIIMSSQFLCCIWTVAALILRNPPSFVHQRRCVDCLNEGYTPSWEIESKHITTMAVCSTASQRDDKSTNNKSRWLCHPIRCRENNGPGWTVVGFHRPGRWQWANGRASVRGDNSTIRCRDDGIR